MHKRVLRSWQHARELQGKVHVLDLQPYWAKAAVQQKMCTGTDLRRCMAKTHINLLIMLKSLFSAEYRLSIHWTSLSLTFFINGIKFFALLNFVCLDTSINLALSICSFPATMLVLTFVLGISRILMNRLASTTSFVEGQPEKPIVRTEIPGPRSASLKTNLQAISVSQSLYI